MRLQSKIKQKHKTNKKDSRFVSPLHLQHLYLVSLTASGSGLGGGVSDTTPLLGPISFRCFLSKICSSGDHRTEVMYWRSSTKRIRMPTTLGYGDNYSSHGLTVP